MDDMSQMINSFLSDPNSMDKIKGIMGMLGIDPEGGPPNGPASPDPPRAQNPANTAGPMEPPANAGPPDTGNLPFDPAMMLRMKKAFDLMRQDDPRISLLLALKPNLSEPRRKRVDEAIHLMRLINLIPLLQEGNLF